MECWNDVEEGRLDGVEGVVVVVIAEVVIAGQTGPE